jgi:DNA-binding protein
MMRASPEHGMKRIGTILIALAAILLAGFAANDIRSDMVRLDKVYIATLALTSQGKAAESRKAVDALQGTWREFKGRHYAANPKDPQWKPDFDRVSGMVEEAVKIVAAGRPVNEAHEALEHVREVLMKLRERNSIDYFIDSLTAFHEPMEAIVLAAKDKSGDTLTDADVARIRNMLPQAERAWQRVAAAKLDARDYGLNAAQAKDARKLMDLEQDSLAALNAALAADDKARIARAATAIKPNFAKLFMTFGDFRPYGS